MNPRVEDKKQLGTCCTSRNTCKRSSLKSKLSILVRECNNANKKQHWGGGCVLTLREKYAQALISDMEHSIEKSGGSEGMAKAIQSLKSHQQQEELANRLVEDPLDPARNSPGPLTLEEQHKLKLQRFYLIDVSCKVPDRLKSLIADELVKQFSPVYNRMVYKLITNIWFQILLPDGLSMPKGPLPLPLPLPLPEEEDILRKLIHKFELAAPMGSPAEEIFTELAQKLVLAFKELSPGEDSVTLGVHNISLAN